MGTSPRMHIPAIVLMGVSGSGKSTVGARLSAALGVPFVDGDDLHPDGNREKMRAGHPLGDDDRWPWLARIGELIDAGVAEGHGTIVACSALKRIYRDRLRRRSPELLFVHLDGNPELLASRLTAREHEYMPVSLLASQLATLEPFAPEERGMVVDIAHGPDDIVATIARALRSR